jgi:hypothetical protein
MKELIEDIKQGDPATFRNIKFLQNLIDEHRMKAKHVVYRLKYAGKFIIVSGKSLGGSLYFIQLGYSWFGDATKKPDTLYLHLYEHVKAHPRGRARVDIILETTDQYEYLKGAHEALNQARYDPKCLNNTVEPYIPNYNDETEMYGWLDRPAVLNYKKWAKRAAAPQ